MAMLNNQRVLSNFNDWKLRNGKDRPSLAKKRGPPSRHTPPCHPSHPQRLPS